MIALVNHAGSVLVNNFGSVLVVPSITPAPTPTPAAVFMFDPFDGGIRKQFVDNEWLGVEFS